MHYAIYNEQEKTEYSICLLTPIIQKTTIKQEYIDPFNLNKDDILVMDLHTSGKKTPVSEMKQYISDELVSVFIEAKIKYLIVSDAEYFKVLTKSKKAEAQLGYVLDCVFGPWKVIYVPNYRSIFYNPEATRAKINQSINALLDYISNSYVPPGVNVIKYSDYPHSPKDIGKWLDRLIERNVPLTCDIEAFSLKHYDSGIATITFCWNKNEGIAFPVDLGRSPVKVRKLLKSFFERFENKIIYHSIAFDVTVLVFQLFMSHILDQKGMLYGLKVMLKNWGCTKLITYLATNSCAGNQLSLKIQSQEYCGDYSMGEDIKNVRVIPLPELLKYNLIDGLGTWFVHEKHWNTLIADQQLELYEGLFEQATRDIIQMQLTGMPVNMSRVLEVEHTLNLEYEKTKKRIRDNKLIQSYTHHLNEKWVIKRNNELKVKRVTLGDSSEVFNPNSPTQLQDFLFNVLALPVLTFTKTNLPSTDKDAISALLNHTDDPEILDFLNALHDYKAVDKIITSFIPALLGAQLGNDGWHYLFGNFNLGGTLSGRLSSSKPNLQNLPSSSLYGKLIKSCFEAPPGWIFAGLDFDSLEDKISAVTTKDPNKLKVYTDGYDGHCLRAYAYFGEDMPDIIEGSVKSINSIKKKYPSQRQDSKVPTFALTYAAKYRTLMVKCGFNEEKAMKIEKRYHELYEVSDKWVSDKLDAATNTGYVTAAFGLRVRTPLLKQVIRTTSKTPYEAEAEGRSAGNALGQSWCLLNSRASAEFMGKVRESKHALDIKPCAQIHDANYYIIRDDIDALLYTNKHLVKAVEWQEHPDIYHDDVKLSGKLAIFHPTWAKEHDIPNGASKDDIYALVDKIIAQD